MTPSTEPNSLPPNFADWQDWRDLYRSHVADFNDSSKTYSDEVLLKIRLRRMEFIGVRLDDEIRHIKENV